MSESPFLHRVPKDPAKNLRWRVRMRRAAMGDVELRTALRQAAFDDLLFFINAFCWGYDPRSADKLQPFITWPHQDRVFLGIDRAIQDAERLEDPIDVPILKSRGQGGTWGCLFVCVRRWLRDPLFSAGLVTRNEKLVDSDVDPDAMMWKAAFTLKTLPFWMLPKGFSFKLHRKLAEHSIVNPENRSTLVGYANTSDVGRGGRRTLFLLDEFGSKEFQVNDRDHELLTALHHNTNCVLMPSTYGSDHGAFYEAANEPDSETTRKYVLDWKDNPKHNRLRYTIREGVAVAIDPSDQPEVSAYVAQNAKAMRRLEARGFIKDGRQRSPWYDRRCLRPSTRPRDIARELDMDPMGAVGKLFNAEVLARMRRDKVRPPAWQGKVIVVDSKARLVRQDTGPLKLWFEPGLDDAPPFGRFVIGADISTGSGGPEAGNSALVGADVRTGAQAIEYASSTISETHFARLAVALCRWLSKATLIWEATGPTGRRFANEVLKEICYENVWLRPREDVRSHEITQKAGWVNNRTSDKADLFDDLWVSMDDGLFSPRSEDFLAECGGWEWDNERILYKGTGHGDRAIAGGLCWKAMKDLMHVGLDNRQNPPQDVRYGTMAWRIQQAAAKQRQRRDGDDEGVDLRGLLEGRFDDSAEWADAGARD